MSLIDKKIPKKNYIKLFIICALTLILVFILRAKYISYQENQKKISIIGSVVNQINYEEINDYLRDNPNSILYIGAADDYNCRNIETKLKKYIMDNNLGQEIIYLNITNNENRHSIIDEINQKYGEDIEINSYPALVIFKNGIIYDAVSKKNYTQLEYSEIIQILEMYEVGK